jgi:hypothetical protein
MACEGKVRGNFQSFVLQYIAVSSVLRVRKDSRRWIARCYTKVRLIESQSVSCIQHPVEWESLCLGYDVALLQSTSLRDPSCRAAMMDAAPESTCSDPLKYLGMNHFSGPAQNPKIVQIQNPSIVGRSEQLAKIRLESWILHGKRNLCTVTAGEKIKK